jgi:hypothetical protein
MARVNPTLEARIVQLGRRVLAEERAEHVAYCCKQSPIPSHLERRTVPNVLQGIPAVALLLVATVLEVSGDAVVRMAIYNHVGFPRLGLFLAGAALLFGYGLFLNLAPLEFGRVVGLYLATLFVVWQVIAFVAFRALPTLPIVVGGSLVIAGGAIITFWKPA